MHHAPLVSDNSQLASHNFKEVVHAQRYIMGDAMSKIKGANSLTLSSLQFLSWDSTIVDPMKLVSLCNITWKNVLFGRGPISRDFISRDPMIEIVTL